MAFEFSLQTAIVGAIGSSAILAGALYYLWRLEPAQRHLRFWALAFSLQALRMGAQLGVALGASSLWLATDILFASITLLLWKGADALSGARGHRRIVTLLLAGCIVWELLAFAGDLPFFVRVMPLYGLAGGTLLYAAQAIWKLADREPGIGHRLLASLLGVLGLHYFDYPFLRNADWFAPIGFALAASLMLAIGLTVVIIAQRRQQIALSEVSRRLRAEMEDRKESDERYRTLVNELEEGIIVVGQDETVLLTNPAASRILRISLAELDTRGGYKRPYVLYRESGAQLNAEDYPLHVALRQGRPSPAEVYRMVHADGHESWLSINAHPMYRDGASEPYAAIVSLADVNTRKAAEQRLTESEMRFRAIAESSELGVVVADAEGRFVYCNSRYLTLSASTSEEVHNGEWIRHLHPDDREPMRAHWRKAIAHHTGFTMERRVVNADGSILWAQVHIVPIRTESGDFRGFVATVEEITARKKAEEALRASEAKFRAIFDQAFQFIGLLDVEGRVVDANQTALQFAGLAHADVIGRYFWETAWWPDDDEKVLLKDAIERAAAGETVRFETAHPDAQGQMHHIDFSLKPVRDGNGRVLMLIPEGRDITSLKETEAALRLSEGKFSGAFHGSLDYITISRMDSGEILDANDAFERVSGWRRDEAIGRTSLDLGIWPEPEARRIAVEQIRRDGFLREYPMVLGTREGGRLKGLLSASIIDVGGERFMLGVFRDRTAEMAAEAALRESEEKFSRIVHYSPVALVLTDTGDGKVVDFNQAWQDLFGFSREEAIGRNSADFGLWYDREDRERLYAAIREGGDRLDRHECRYRHASGHALYCLASGRKIEMPGRSCYLWSIIDISLQHDLAARLAQLNAELEARVERRTMELRHTQNELVRSEKLAALGSLVAGIAHELNTPIGNAVTVASTLQEKTQHFGEAIKGGELRRSTLNEYLGSATTASDLLLRNLEQARNLVSSFKQVAVDQTSEQRRRFHLAEVVGEILTTLSPTLRKLPYRVTMDIPPEIALDSYPGPLGQIVTNLINNALVHAFDGRTEGCIRIAASTGDEVGEAGRHFIRFEFSDDGIGISEEDQRRIFDPFFTTKLGRGGSGLGLNIVYNIVTNILGGSIDIRSRLGEGSMFVLKIPSKGPDPAEQTRQADER